jgi:hypothetical protein
MERDTLILKRASAARPCGEWNFDVLADGAVVGRTFKADAGLRTATNSSYVAKFLNAGQ